MLACLRNFVTGLGEIKEKQEVIYHIINIYYIINSINLKVKHFQFQSICFSSQNVKYILYYIPTQNKSATLH